MTTWTRWAKTVQGASRPSSVSQHDLAFGVPQAPGPQHADGGHARHLPEVVAEKRDPASRSSGRWRASSSSSTPVMSTARTQSSRHSPFWSPWANMVLQLPPATQRAYVGGRGASSRPSCARSSAPPTPPPRPPRRTNPPIGPPTRTRSRCRWSALAWPGHEHSRDRDEQQRLGSCEGGGPEEQAEEQEVHASGSAAHAIATCTASSDAVGSSSVQTSPRPAARGRARSGPG